MLRLPLLLGTVLTIVSLSVVASPLPHGASSCFTGNYESFESYYASIQKSTKGEIDDVKQKAIRSSYDRWRNVDREKVSCHFFNYIVDDIPVTGFILKPLNGKESDLLPVIFNRGGNADGVIGTPYLYDKLAPFAAQGFLVIGSFYRGAKINGVESPHRLADQFGGNDVNDILQLLPIIDSFDGMKEKKVGMWGVSRGGMMAFLAAKQSNRFSAIVSDSAPVDLMAEANATDRMERVFETWIPNYKKQKETELTKRSVAYWHKELNNIPILILHGSNDSRVSPVNILDFAKQLQLSGHPYELIMYHAGGHGLRGLESDVNTKVADWLSRHAE